MAPPRNKNTDLKVINTAFPVSALFDQHKYLVLSHLSLLT